MRKNNEDVRSHANQSGVYLYEIAAELKMTDGNFSRLLRFELPFAKKEEIFSIIAKLDQRKTTDN